MTYEKLILNYYYYINFFFLSGEYFWLYDDQQKLLLQRHRSIKEHFKGVRTPIDDVLTWKSGKYFYIIHL